MTTRGYSYASGTRFSRPLRQLPLGMLRTATAFPAIPPGWRCGLGLRFKSMTRLVQIIKTLSARARSTMFLRHHYRHPPLLLGHRDTGLLSHCKETSGTTTISESTATHIVFVSMAL